MMRLSGAATLTLRCSRLNPPTSPDPVRAASRRNQLELTAEPAAVVLMSSRVLLLPQVEAERPKTVCVTTSEVLFMLSPSPLCVLISQQRAHAPVFIQISISIKGSDFNTGRLHKNEFLEQNQLSNVRVG